MPRTSRSALPSDPTYSRASRFGRTKLPLDLALRLPRTHRDAQDLAHRHSVCACGCQARVEFGLGLRRAKGALGDLQWNRAVGRVDMHGATRALGPDGIMTAHAPTHPLTW